MVPWSPSEPPLVATGNRAVLTMCTLYFSSIVHKNTNTKSTTASLNTEVQQRREWQQFIDRTSMSSVSPGTQERCTQPYAVRPANCSKWWDRRQRMTSNRSLYRLLARTSSGRRQNVDACDQAVSSEVDCIQRDTVELDRRGT